MPGLAVCGMLRKVVAAAQRTLAEVIAEECRAVLATMGTADQRERRMAFLEKRPPRFNRGEG